ncbi:hypothetical protein [Brevibacillus dissolubilis]|uniref:hypothetical protein n=1 Tax=Brevibacillus dissolubilis TaxID=1844116 RepID=UPI00159BEBD5|nr:hypothetical protein [Brevibacillus dissolubilis]
MKQGGGVDLRPAVFLFHHSVPIAGSEMVMKHIIPSGKYKKISILLKAFTIQLNQAFH